jgi:isoleucyl-tRNA synthetase
VDKPAYKDTLHLPRTDFPMKANLPQREPEMLATWQREGLYQAMVAAARRSGKPAFLLHDGPPYANGHLHAGHILNKVLKDVIVKFRNLNGNPCEYIPGWDCHGLPIERNVEQEKGRALKVEDPVRFRRECRAYAEKFVAIQRREFERLGCLGEWDHPYLTMSYGYEAHIAQELGRVVASGAVYRGKKPVYWCHECETALAEAEVEYADHKSPAIYVRFPLADDARAKLGVPAGKPASVLIWTTTPWTLPANLAVCFHPDFDYVAALVQGGGQGGHVAPQAIDVGGEIILVAEGRLSATLGLLGTDRFTRLAALKGRELEGLHCHHPFIERESLFILGEHVTLDTGTGCVHTAPGHGEEDYVVARQYGLEPYSPVDDRGRFTREVPQFQGRLVFDTDGDICALLEGRGALVAKEVISHSYPHCWRSRTPVIFRSTTQWFVSMEKTLAGGRNLRQTALEQIDQQVQWIPAWGRERIHGMVANRPDWCISRQRHWGVPIIALYCRECGEVLQTPALFEHVVKLFREGGADAWFDLPADKLAPAGTRCPKCDGADFKKETDILDVWFDSGVSYAAVMEDRYRPDVVTDLYLEGSDQHRGWFHSALLEACVTRGRAPYRSVLTHGFTVDGAGKKLSKKDGNYIPPDEILKKYGADILRLWVAAADYTDDIRMSEEILSGLADAYRKIRNTLRFLLANLGDFQPSRDAATDEAGLDVLDRLMLGKYRVFRANVARAYGAYEFHRVVHEVLDFFTGPLSAVYLDFLKDRLYAERQDDPRRRSSQTVLYTMLRETLVLLAPVLSFTADEAWRMMPKREGDPGSVFLAQWPLAANETASEADQARARDWDRLVALRAAVAVKLEEARNAKVIGHSLEAATHLVLSQAPALGFAELLRDLGPAALREALIVSGLEVALGPVDDPSGVEVTVARASGEKCERCWIRTEEVGRDATHPTLCARCIGVLNG